MSKASRNKSAFKGWMKKRIICPYAPCAIRQNRVRIKAGSTTHCNNGHQIKFNIEGKIIQDWKQVGLEGADYNTRLRRGDDERS